MSTNFLGVGMNEFDELPSVSAEEIFCYLGLGMLAAGMVVGVLFVAVPLVQWAVKNKRHAVNKSNEAAVDTELNGQLLTTRFAQAESL